MKAHRPQAASGQGPQQVRFALLMARQAMAQRQQPAAPGIGQGILQHHERRAELRRLELTRRKREIRRVEREGIPVSEPLRNIAKGAVVASLPVRRGKRQFAGLPHRPA